MVDITADSTVYPSANDIAETAKEGRFATEQSHTDYVEKWLASYVESGFTLPATDPDLTIPVAAGTAVVKGRRIVVSTITNITIVANQTNHIFLSFSVDGNGDVDNVDIVSNTTGAAPTNSVKIGRAITDATTVTSTKDERPASPYRTRLVGPEQLNNFFGEGSDVTETVSSTSLVNLTGISVAIAQNEAGFRPDTLTDIRVLVMYQAEIESVSSASDIEIALQKVGDDSGASLIKLARITAPAIGTKHSISVMGTVLLSVLEGWTIRAQAKRIGSFSITLREGRFVVIGVE